MRTAWALILLVIGCAEVTDVGLDAARPSASSGQRLNSPNDETGWLGSAWLDDSQKSTLEALALESSVPLEVSVWPRGGTVRSIRLDVPSGAAENAEVEEHATAFITAHLNLWRLTDDHRLIVRPVGPDCNSVRIELIHDSGLPIFNAALTVDVSDAGRILQVSGWMTGESVAVSGIQLPAEQAAVELSNALDLEPLESGDRELPAAARQVVFDPFFVADRPHAATFAWELPVADAEGQLQETLVLDGKSKRVVARTHVVAAGGSKTGCQAASDALLQFPLIVVDPYTNTPALVSFRHAGGIPTSGTNSTERMIDLYHRLRLDLYYGSNRPDLHLVLVDERIDPRTGNTSAYFQEYFAGVRVEGAGLTFTFAPDGGALSILGRFINYPGIEDVTPALTPNDVLATARDAVVLVGCGGESACAESAAEEEFEVATASELVVLSSHIVRSAKMVDGPHALAWRFPFSAGDSYIDANTGAVLTVVPRKSYASRYSIYGGRSGKLMKDQDGWVATNLSGNDEVLDGAQAQMAETWLLQLNDFQESLLGWAGMREYLSPHITIRVGHSGNDPSFTYDQLVATREPVAAYIRVPTNALNSDIFAHEFYHGFGVFTGGMYTDRDWEHGAVRESLADILAESAFPSSNGTWEIGEESDYPEHLYLYDALRDAKNPSRYFNMPEHLAFLDDDCAYFELLDWNWFSDDGCEHFWAGPVNRAATLIADGVPGVPLPGTGRYALAGLLLHTQVKQLLKGYPVFTTLRAAVFDTCRELAEDADGPIFGRDWSYLDCDLVDLAYTSVGLENGFYYGWYQTDNALLSGSTDNLTFRSGQSLFHECYLSDQILRMTTFKGTNLQSGWADGMNVRLANGEAGAYVTSRASSRDPAQLEIDVRVWSNWNHRNAVQVDPIVEFPPNPPAFLLSKRHCFAPEGAEPIWAYSKARVSEYASFFDGGKGDKYFNVGVSLPPGCVVESVEGVHYHDGNRQGTMKEVGHGGHGYRAHRPNVDPQLLDARLHWWHSGVTSITARVAYLLHVPEGSGTMCIDALPNNLRSEP